MPTYCDGSSTDCPTMNVLWAWQRLVLSLSTFFTAACPWLYQSLSTACPQLYDPCPQLHHTSSTALSSLSTASPQLVPSFTAIFHQLPHSLTTFYHSFTTVWLHLRFYHSFTTVCSQLHHHCPQTERTVLAILSTACNYCTLFRASLLHLVDSSLASSYPLPIHNWYTACPQLHHCLSDSAISP